MSGRGSGAPSPKDRRAATAGKRRSPADIEERRAAARADVRKHRRRAAVLFVGVIAIFIAVMVLRHTHSPAGATDKTKASATKQATPHYSVGLVSCTFVDHSRATPDFFTHTSNPGRILVTEIRYPSLAHDSASELRNAVPARRDGPFPTVVFGEGYDLTPEHYEILLDAWVRAGFVVVAPLFPDTNANAVPSGSSLPESDDVNQPLDVAFVTRSVLADSVHRSSCATLYHLVNPAKLALAGQSDGGEAVAALAYDANYRASSPHYRAVAVLSGEEFASATGTPDPYRAKPGDPALLVVQSLTDECNPPQFSTTLYDDIDQSDRWFLELKNAYHLPPYDGSDPAAFAVVSSVTTRFFRLEFASSSPGASFVKSADADPAVATLTAHGGAPDVANLEEEPSTCYLEGVRP